LKQSVCISGKGRSFYRRFQATNNIFTSTLKTEENTGKHVRYPDLS